MAFHTLKTGKKVLSLEEFLALWNNLKHPEGPLICTHSNTFVELKKLWETCVTNGACSFVTDDQKNQASNFFSNVQSVSRGGN